MNDEKDTLSSQFFKIFWLQLLEVDEKYNLTTFTLNQEITFTLSEYIILQKWENKFCKFHRSEEKLFMVGTSSFEITYMKKKFFKWLITQ